MIFITVGSELPFNRLVRVVDDWARVNGRTDVFAQIGSTNWKPSFVSYSRFLEPPEFTKLFACASTIVSHAGMGTILSALHFGKPILVMPRRGSLAETRNEHQLATARHLSAVGKIDVAFDEVELRTKLETVDSLSPRERIGAYAERDLLDSIRAFIRQDGRLVL